MANRVQVPGSRASTVDLLLSSIGADAPVGKVVSALRWTIVLLNTTPVRAGLASNPHEPGETLATMPAAVPMDLPTSSARELAAWLRSGDAKEAAVGMAAFNALLNVDESACREVNASDILVEKARGRRVAIIGHFPFVDQIRQVASRCSVLELRPRPGDVAAEKAAEILPHADLVGITGTSLLNHTYDGLIGLCRPGAFVIVLGGTAPLSPIMLDTGADAVAGTRLLDPEAAAYAVARHATFREIPGKRLLTLMRKDG